MSALAKSAVSLYPTIASGGLSASEFFSDNPQLVTRRLRLTLTGQGTQTNKITAESLGFELITSVSNLFDDQNNKGYMAAVNPVLNIVVLFDGAAAPAPVDVTSTGAYLTVTGVLKYSPSLT